METKINVNESVSFTKPSAQNEWDRIANSSAFREMVQKKKAFLVPATIFFLVYYFILPILAGYAKSLMAVKIIGNLNFGYLFALSQFVMAWILAHLYAKKANEFDQTAAEMRKQMKGGLEK